MPLALSTMTVARTFASARRQIAHFVLHKPDGDDVVYPKDYVFDRCDRNREDNILYEEGSEDLVSPAKSGQFLVLKNNPERHWILVHRCFELIQRSGRNSRC